MLSISHSLNSAPQEENSLKIFAVDLSGSVNTNLCRKLDVMGESASNLMGFTVPCIGAEYIHLNSVMSALNSWLLGSSHGEIYLITDCCYLLFIYWGRWKEGAVSWP